ncbi:hypothetical protein RvY_10216 [Ramazzottius varieornatus]|uniref:Uncharacterized protein n=1 Tax=Ramazzottius varieornatus TaxID=947166 RepID=A0A1D1VE51_RAMVA|nr:hypothetical protein RvY_10216 [Ramazzottius varieornatus]
MFQLEFGTMIMDSTISELVTAIRRLNATSSSDPEIRGLLKTISSRLDIATQCIQLNKILVSLLNRTVAQHANWSSSQGITTSLPSQYAADVHGVTYSNKPGSDDHLFDEGADSMFNTVIVLIIFVVGITLLIIRSTRGGVCEQCQVPAEEVVTPPKKMFFLNTTQIDQRRRRLSKVGDQPAELTAVRKHHERRNQETVIDMVLENESDERPNNRVTFAETDL